MMTQTTNNVFNSSLFDQISPKSLLAWQRVRLAHSLAHTGEEWAKIFSRYNSGKWARRTSVNGTCGLETRWVVSSTLNIFFFKSSKICCRYVQQPVYGVGQEQSEARLRYFRWRFNCGGADSRPGGILGPNASTTPRSKQTLLNNAFKKKKILSFEDLICFCLPPAGYWPSYNVPFHQNIYKLSGYDEMWQRYGEDFSYDLCARAKIFRRDQADVKDLDSLKHIMRFNGGFWSQPPHPGTVPLLTCIVLLLRVDDWLMSSWT